MEHKDLLYRCLENPNTITTQIAKDIYVLVQAYPFSTHLRLIQLMYLKKYDISEYNKQLSKLALMFPDRGFLQQKIAMIDETNTKQEYKNESFISTNTIVSSSTLEDIKPSVESQHSEDLLSIVRLRLQEINHQQSDDKTEEPKNALEKYKEQIEKFISEEPTVKLEKHTVDNRDLAEESVQDRYDIVSETLAQIYEKQGNKLKAIEIFNQLIIKYPEKSSYFANQIERLQTQNN